MGLIELGTGVFDIGVFLTRVRWEEMGGKARKKTGRRDDKSEKYQTHLALRLHINRIVKSPEEVVAHRVRAIRNTRVRGKHPYRQNLLHTERVGKPPLPPRRHIQHRLELPKIQLLLHDPPLLVIPTAHRCRTVVLGLPTDDRPIMEHPPHLCDLFLAAHQREGRARRGGAIVRRADLADE